MVDSAVQYSAVQYSTVQYNTVKQVQQEQSSTLFKTPSIIYFWKPQAKSSSMKMTPTIMITIRNLWRMNDLLQVWGGS